MPVPTLHTSLTPIWNVRQSFVWTGLLDHRTWIRLSMHGTFFRVRFQPDLCNPRLYRSSRMHWLLNEGCFHKTGYRLWLRACTEDVVRLLMPVDVVCVIRQVFHNKFRTMWKFSLLESFVLGQILMVPRPSLCQVLMRRHLTLEIYKSFWMIYFLSYCFNFGFN